MRYIFNFIKKFLLFISLFLSSCSQLPIDNNAIKDEAVKLVIKSLKPQIETIFNEAAPIAPAGRLDYPLTQKLPGPTFDPYKVFSGELKYDSNGNLLLLQGDYVIPVMTYCMKHSGTSPIGHIYSLSKLEGTRAVMIRELNLRAPPKFNGQDIQIVSWSLQAGLAYDEMTKISKNIIDEVIPQFKSELKESFLSILEKKWDRASNASHGLFPTFANSSDDLLNELGIVGQKINEIRKFKNRLHDVGNDYSRLSELINITSNLNKKEISETSWSQISNNIYARFVTDGHFQDIGFVQIRILAGGLNTAQKREINSTSINDVVFDLLSLLANPNSDVIQPLTFSPLYGFAGVMVLPALADSPLAATMILAAVLAAKTIDWDSFFKLYDLLKDSSYPQVQKELDKGIHALQDAHDELEKPLREAGIINGKTKDTSTDKKNDTRQYDKSGGEKELEKDFDKLPGETQISSDGTEYKVLPNGSKVVKRPLEDGKPTLEVQPSKNNPKIYKGLRIKVRYP